MDGGGRCTLNGQALEADVLAESTEMRIDANRPCRAG
jgi:hypothetical protein